MIKTIKNALTGAQKVVAGEWRYKGITNRFMNRHSWTNGTETVHIFYMNGAGSHAGLVVEAKSKGSDATLSISNGFIQSMRHALILADLYMRDDGPGPSAFMHSDRVESDHAPGSAVRQDEWLAAHGHDYEFQVVDPADVTH